MYAPLSAQPTPPIPQSYYRGRPLDTTNASTMRLAALILGVCLSFAVPQVEGVGLLIRPEKGECLKVDGIVGEEIEIRCVWVCVYVCMRV